MADTTYCLGKTEEKRICKSLDFFLPLNEADFKSCLHLLFTSNISTNSLHPYHVSLIGFDVFSQHSSVQTSFLLCANKQHNHGIKIGRMRLALRLMIISFRMGKVQMTPALFLGH